MSVNGQPPPPPRATIREASLYVLGGLVLLLHLFVLGAMMVIKDYVAPFVCDGIGIHTWEYWSLGPQAGFTVLGIAAFGFLLYHTLWKEAFYVAVVMNIGCAALHFVAAMYWIQWKKSCSSHFQCFGCDIGPAFPMTDWAKAYLALTCCLSAANLFEFVWDIIIFNYTGVQGVLWWAYGANESAFTTYDAVPRSLYGYPGNTSIGVTTSSGNSIAGTIDEARQKLIAGKHIGDGIAG